MKDDSNIKDLLTNLDVLIDGRFDKKKMNKKDKFPITTNQRVIDVQKSLKIQFVRQNIHQCFLICFVAKPQNLSSWCLC